MTCRRAAAAGVLAFALLGGVGAGSVSAGDEPLHTLALPEPDATDVLGCNWTASTSRAAELFQFGRVRLGPFDPVTTPLDGNVNWGINPFKHPSWETRFRDLRWLSPLIGAALAPGIDPATKAAYLARVRTIIQDWVRDNPRSAKKSLPFTWSPPSAVAHRVSFLLCAKEAFGNAAWLDRAIREHGAVLTQRWAGSWNHGTMEAMALYRVGCWSKDAQAKRTGRARLLKSFESGGVGPVLDNQGATNEQSVGYANFVYKLWNDAMRLMRECGDAVPSVMRARVAKMPEFLAAATQPDGNLVQIGDTETRPAAVIPGTVAQYAVTQGAAGPRPTQRVWVYRRGYVFGHSGWGEQRPRAQESFYSLRFGVKRQVHGHDDHTSMTYFARGLPMLVDSGHNGYKPGAQRSFLKSAAAHNVLEVAGVKPRNVATSLTRKVLRKGWQSYTLTDRAFGFTRTRNVLFAQGPEIAVVHDSTGSAGRSRTFRQLWHLAPTMNVTRTRNGVAKATPRSGADARLWLIPVRLGGDGKTQVVRGRTRPRQGWVSEQILEARKAPVVQMTSTAHAARMLTVIVPAAKSSTVKTSVKNLGTGAKLLTVRIDGKAYKFRIAARGALTRV